MDLSKLNDQQLVELKASGGDLSKLSTETLLALRGAQQKQPTPGPKVETPGVITGTVRALAKGASANFADEVAAAANAALQPAAGVVNRNVPDVYKPALLATPAAGTLLAADEAGKSAPGVTFGERYSRNLDVERAKDAQFRKEHPLLSIGGEVVGTIGGTLATLPNALLRMPATLPRMMGQGALVGGGTGAIAGFGGGEGGIENRLLEAGTGGAMGAGIGALAPLAILPVTKAYQWTRNALGLQNPGKMATAKAVQAFERDFQANKALPPPQAGQYQPTSFDDAAAELARLRASGKPAAVFDVGGENVAGLTRAAAGTPGPAKQTAVSVIEARQGSMGAPAGSGQAGRVVESADRALGVQSGKFGQTFDDLLVSARAAASPVYKKAYEYNGGIIQSDKLDALLTRPSMKAALARGARLAADEGEDIAALGVKGFNEAGDPIIGGTINIRGWDYIKRGLDDVVQANRDQFGKLTQQGRAVDALRKKVLAEVDALNPFYAEARSAWAGPMAMRDAMQLGRDVLKEEGGYQIAKQVAALGESEKRAFLQGVAEAIRDKAMATGDTNNAVRAIMGKPILREKIQAAFPDEASYKAFLRDMLDESRMFQRAGAVSPRSGSMTDLRAAERADMAGDMLGDVAKSMVTGTSPVNTLLRLGISARDRLGGLNAPTATSLTDMLFSGDPAVIAALREAQARGTPTARSVRYIGAPAGAIADQARR